VSDVLVRLLLVLGRVPDTREGFFLRGRDRHFLETELDTLLTDIVKSLSTLLLGTGLLGLNAEALLLDSFTLLSREGTLVILHLLVVLGDSLLDFLGKLFTSLIGSIKLGLIL